MISSTNNMLIKEIAKLQQKKYRDLTNRFIAEGEHLALEARLQNIIEYVFVTEANLEFKDAILVSPHVMKKMSDTKHIPNIITICKKDFETKIHDKVLILDHIQDPGNVGTLLRTALAFSYHTIVLNQCADVYSPKVVRATQGAIFKLSIIEKDVETFKLENPHHHLIAAVSKGGTMTLSKKETPFALILGNEGQGLPSHLQELADHTVTIPLESVESLNVAIAGAILMYVL